jgi:hypothetical protein
MPVWRFWLDQWEGGTPVAEPDAEEVKEAEEAPLAVNKGTWAGRPPEGRVDELERDMEEVITYEVFESLSSLILVVLKVGLTSPEGKHGLGVSVIIEGSRSSLSVRCGDKGGD